MGRIASEWRRRALSAICAGVTPCVPARAISEGSTQGIEPSPKGIQGMKTRRSRSQ